MPRVLKQLKEQPDLVDKYVAAFAGEPALKQALAKFFLVLLDKFFVIPAGTCNLQVGFSFVRSHSSGLFEKSNATIRGVELNPEAGSF